MRVDEVLGSGGLVCCCVISESLWRQQVGNKDAREKKF